jgi:hypothetical protein
MLYFTLNDSLVDIGYAVCSQSFTQSQNLGIIYEIPLIANLLKTGTYANRFCVIVPYVTVGGVRKELGLTNFYCAGFTAEAEVGINDIDNLQEVKIFPNPVRDNNLKIENIDVVTDVHLYSITGQLIQKAPAVMGDVNMDVSNLSNGIYILKMQSGKNIRTEKIQIIR